MKEDDDDEMAQREPNFNDAINAVPKEAHNTRLALKNYDGAEHLPHRESDKDGWMEHQHTFLIGEIEESQRGIVLGPISYICNKKRLYWTSVKNILMGHPDSLKQAQVLGNN